MTYKFKYTYLILILVNIALIAATILIPTCEDLKNDEIVSTVSSILRSVFISSLSGLMISFIYKHRFEVEEKEKLLKDVNEIFSETLEEKIINSILYNKESQEKLLKKERLDEILYNSLRLKVGNDSEAKGIMESFINRIVNVSDTVRELDIKMKLESFDNADRKYCKYDVYKMTNIYSYYTILKKDTFDFMLTNSRKIQNKNLHKYEYCLFVDSSFTGSSIYFEIEQISIDGINLEKVNFKNQANEYIAYHYKNEELQSSIGKEVKVIYKISFLVRKSGNHFSHFVPFNTENLHIEFDATNTDIVRLKILPYYNSSIEPVIMNDDDINPRNIQITLTDWVFPKSGQTFIWQYEKK